MTASDTESFAQLAASWNKRDRGLIKEMDLRVEKVGTEGVLVRMPFNRAFCADEAETLIHGGVLTALLDSVFGLANYVAVRSVSTMATLDLRIDYLRPARSRVDLLVRAECYRQTRHIAFNSGSIWFDGAEDEEVARGFASFALTRGPSSLLGAIDTQARE